jgi:hypothetical protein
MVRTESRGMTYEIGGEGLGLYTKHDGVARSSNSNDGGAVLFCSRSQFICLSNKRRKMSCLSSVLSL